MKTHFENAAMILRNVRRYVGLTQSQFAQKLGVHQTMVSSWERGLCAPPLARLNDVFADVPAQYRKDYTDMVIQDGREQVLEQMKEIGFYSAQ
jgi:transcriptional regulator with XRE-family HTH domain